MARFVDLEEDGADSSPIPDPHILTLLQASHIGERNGDAVAKPAEPEDVPRATVRSAVTEAFQCYPYAVLV